MMPVSETELANMSDQPSNDQTQFTSTQDTSLPDAKQEDAASKDRNSSKENYYIKKHIIAAINRSFKTNDKVIHHKFAVNDDEKNSDPKTRQSMTVIVKRIDFDKESILFTKEKGIPDIINLEAFKIKEISNHDSTHLNSSNHSNEKKRSSDDRHRHDRHHSSSRHQPSDKKRDEHRSDRKYHISAETLKGPYLLCSCGRKESKKWTHEDCTNKCCRSTSYYCDSCLRRKIIKNDYNNDILKGVNFNKYMYVVACPFGRGKSLHMDYDRIMHLRSAEQREVATEFLKQAFKEDDKGFAHFTIAIVHNGAKYMPDVLKTVAKLHPSLKVSTTRLKSSTESDMTDLMTYYKKVKETYNNGTYAFDPLNETQAACVKNADECGGYLPEMLSLLEKSPFLSQVLPWGDLTTKRYKTPHESDDGPIFWCRPGEQIVSLDRNSQRNRWNSSEIESFLKERKKNMGMNDEKKLIVEELKKYRRSCSAREFLFEDRTRPHADQAWSNSFEATAAVGVIQAIHPDEHPDYNRICKEIVVFQARHLEMLEALLHIDVTAAPKQQCAEWLDDAKLNMIRQMKIHFSKLCLRDNDIYFIPRKIVHQFKTVSATLSIDVPPERKKIAAYNWSGTSNQKLTIQPTVEDSEESRLPSISPAPWHTRIREYYEKSAESEANDATDAPLTDVSTIENEIQKMPNKNNKITPLKNSNSRSRSTSSGSRSRRTSSSRPHSRKRKHQSRTPSSSKRKKEEPSLTNGDQSKPLECEEQTNMAVNSDCGCLATPIKLEPAEDGEEQSAVSVCPRVNIVDCESAEAKCDSSRNISEKDVIDTKCEENSVCASPEKVESESQIVE